MAKPRWMIGGEKRKSQRLRLSAKSLSLDSRTPFSSVRGLSTGFSSEELEVSDHLVELWKVLRRVVKNIVIFTILIFIMPGFRDGNLLISPFEPLVLQVFNGIIAHIFNSFDQDSVEIFIGSPLTIISMYINLAVFMGVVLSLPMTIRELIIFMRPGITDKEYETLKTISKNGAFLFLLGVVISYWLILPNTLKILVNSGSIIGEASLLQMYSISSIMNLMLWGSLAGGLLYAAPLVLVALVNLEVLETINVANRRREIYFGIFVLAAFITPDPTVISMIILSLPMLVIVEYMITWGYKIELQRLVNS